MAGEKKGPSFRPLEEVLQEIRGVEGPPPAAMAVTAAEAVQAAEAVLAAEAVRTVEAVSGEEAAPTAEAVPAEGAVSAVEASPADGVEAAAEVLPGLLGAGVLVSLGDSLPLEGSCWADCEMSSASGESAEAVLGGVRRRTSSGGEQPELSAEAGRSELREQVRRRRKKRKGMQAGNRAEAVSEGAPLSLSGRYDVLAGDLGEGESSGQVAVQAGPVIGSNEVNLVDGSGVASRPVDLGPVSPLSPARSFLEAGSPSSIAYLQAFESSDSDSSLGAEAEGTVGETERG